jgi:hypothetical protein
MKRLKWLVLSTMGGAAALHFLLPAGQRAEVRGRLASIPATMMARYGRTKAAGPAPETTEASAPPSGAKR